MTRRAMRVYLTQAGVGDEERADLVLALDEACANVIRHAFPDRTCGRIRLRAEADEAQVAVRVEDDGVGFDPASVLPRPGPFATSGRGLGIIRQLVTSVDLESPTETGGTRVVMRKAVRAPAPPPATLAG